LWYVGDEETRDRFRPKEREGTRKKHMRKNYLTPTVKLGERIK